VKGEVVRCRIIIPSAGGNNNGDPALAHFATTTALKCGRVSRVEQIFSSVPADAHTYARTACIIILGVHGDIYVHVYIYIYIDI